MSWGAMRPAPASFPAGSDEEPDNLKIRPGPTLEDMPAHYSKVIMWRHEDLSSTMLKTLGFPISIPAFSSWDQEPHLLPLEAQCSANPTGQNQSRGWFHLR